MMDGSAWWPQVASTINTAAVYKVAHLPVCSSRPSEANDCWLELPSSCETNAEVTIRACSFNLLDAESTTLGLIVDADFAEETIFDKVCSVPLTCSHACRPT